LNGRKVIDAYLVIFGTIDLPVIRINLPVLPTKDFWTKKESGPGQWLGQYLVSEATAAGLFFLVDFVLLGFSPQFTASSALQSLFPAGLPCIVGISDAQPVRLIQVSTPARQDAVRNVSI
jgi:hypothetical protein